METKTIETKWYALYTRPRWEKKVAETLTRKQIENYCPLNKVLRQWNNRKKIVLEPLFTSHVFVKAAEKEHSEIRKVNGIINFVYWLNKPSIVCNEEIDCIKQFLSEHHNVRLEKTAININSTVRITQGPLMEYEENVIAIKSRIVKIALPSLGYIMVAEVEKTNIKVISNNGFYEEYHMNLYEK